MLRSMGSPLMPPRVTASSLLTFCYSCSTICILFRMTTPVPTRFTSEELKLLDELVAAGVADTRSAVVRAAVIRLADAVRRADTGASIAASYREVPQSEEDDNLALASAVAMTDSEPW